MSGFFVAFLPKARKLHHAPSQASMPICQQFINSSLARETNLRQT